MLSNPWQGAFSDKSKNGVYLDHASTSQTPLVVLDELQRYYTSYRANAGRGVYDWAYETTSGYENARKTVANFVNACPSEVVFTYGATDGLNLLASALFTNIVKQGQIILVSVLEHHSNLLPWQALAKELGCQIMPLPMDEAFNIDWSSLTQLLAENTVGMVAITHVSNVTGHVQDIQRLCSLVGSVPVVVDGTQAVPHMKVDVKALGCAAYVWSSHKMYGPTGVGGLYIAKAYWLYVKPYRRGGGMIEQVTLTHSTYAKGVQLLEAGTMPLGSVLGFAKACELLTHWGQSSIYQYECELIEYLKGQMVNMPVKLYSGSSGSIVSFTHNLAHAHDVATILASDGVMVRSGHHCCMPLIEHFGVSALTRVSVGAHNTQQDIDCFVRALAKAAEVFES